MGRTKCNGEVQINGEYKMDLSQRIDFWHWLRFFENLIWVEEPLTNSWFTVSIPQVYIYFS